jgi:hypothetical protein
MTDGIQPGRLKDALNARGLTLAGVARLLETSESIVRSWNAGRHLNEEPFLEGRLAEPRLSASDHGGLAESADGEPRSVGPLANQLF